MASPREIKYLAAPQSGAGGRVLASPFQFFTTGEESLRITSACSVSGATIAMHYRFLDPEKGIIANRETHTPNSDRTARSTEFSLGAGALLNLSAFAESGAPKSGQCFIRVQLIRGRGAAAVVMGTLVQGYVTEHQDLAWPGSVLQSSTDGPGVLRTIDGTDPAPGSEWAETVPTGAQWHLLGASALLLTTAAVGVRDVWLGVNVGGNIYLRAPISPGVPAATFGLCSWFPNAQYLSAFSAGGTPGPIPAQCILPAGAVVTSVTVGMAALDDWFAVRLFVREWLTLD